ncbi:MAG: ATP-grasp domain-containing protein, partial [Ignavibacteriota bacterium]
MKRATVKPDNIIDAMLTNGWDRIAYNVLRGLSTANLKVAFGTDKNKGMGVFSKYAYSKFLHADYNSEPEKFINDIAEKIIQLKPRVYIPTGEEVFTVAKYINQFNNLEIKIPIASYDNLIKLHNKSISFKIASDLGIPVPKSIIPNSAKEITTFAHEVGYPLVFKSFLSSSSKGVYFVDKAILEKDLEGFLIKNNLNFRDFIVQQYVSGCGYGVSVLFNNGELKALFTHKRIRERIVSGGPSTLRISTHQSELEDYAVCLLKSVNFHGVAMVEFKYDEEKKQGWFIEV